EVVGGQAIGVERPGVGQVQAHPGGVVVGVASVGGEALDLGRDDPATPGAVAVPGQHLHPGHRVDVVAGLQVSGRQRGVPPVPGVARGVVVRVGLGGQVRVVLVDRDGVPAGGGGVHGGGQAGAPGEVV